MSIDWGEARNEGIWKLGNRPMGRRCTILIAFGLLWMLIGAGNILNRLDRFSRLGPGGPLQILDTPPWPGLPWILGGLAAVVCGILRPRLETDGWGFVGLSLPPFVWASFYAASWILSWRWVSDDLYGRPENWLGVPIFLGVCGLVLFINRWPDRDEPWLMHLDDIPPPPRVRR